MTAIILILSIVAGALALWEFNRMVGGDGLGHRPPPPSHAADLDPHTPLWRELVH